jgi:hypothetical protein
MKSFLFALVVGSGLALVSLVGSGCDDLDQAVDCAKICNRYQECFDSDYDVNGCVDRCEDNADDDEAFADAADACESCIDDRACAESFPCAGECIAIVP